MNTPGQLREWAELIADPEYDYRKPSVTDIQEQLHAHADALEELARLKAPVSEGEVATAIAWVRKKMCSKEDLPLCKLAKVSCPCIQDGMVITLIERLAAKVANRAEEIRRTDHIYELILQRAERAEAALAERDAEIAKLRKHAEAGAFVPTGRLPDVEYFLIERGQHEGQAPTVWWRGLEDGTLPYSGRWTESANEAAFYLSHNEAYCVMQFRVGPAARVTSHSWVPSE